MFLAFFASLRQAGVPVSLREYLDLMAGLDADLAGRSLEGFYGLARCVMVKDERHLDLFDRVFGATFKGLQTLAEAVEPVAVPSEWLRKLIEKHLSEEERRQLEALGWDKLMETLRQRLVEQKERHQGGSKWIGTGGTSPFGAYGYNPEGVRIGQDGNRNFRAVKVWDKREYKDLNGDARFGPRAMKLGLRKLRRFARAGAAEELDLDGTIAESARRGYIDVRLRPERRNAVKVLLFLDVGGSMDWHVEQAESLFSAARAEFKHLEHYYFHNCPYEFVWKDNRRRFDARAPTMDVINAYPRDYRLVFVGDASMSPYEIVQPGGAVEHFNPEPGQVWMERLLRAYPRAIWLNPIPKPRWGHAASIGMIAKLMSGRMFSMTLEGLDEAVKALSRSA